MIDRTHPSSVVGQCQLLGVARSTAFDQPTPVSEPVLALMRRIDALREALTQYGRPEIFNTDQGCQFTSLELTGLLNAHGIQISMDGRGGWRDNVVVERLWRSLKYEEVYLRAYETVGDAQQGLAHYLDFYNQFRPHRALDGRTPDRVYWEDRSAQPSAA